MGAAVGKATGAASRSSIRVLRSAEAQVTGKKRQVN